MKKLAALLTLLCLSYSIFSSPPDSLNTKTPPYIKVADWYNFSKAAYSLTFDDGLISQYNHLAPILDKHEIKATFFIITGNLQEDPNQQPTWRFGYWHQFIELAAKGHELGSHTVAHQRLSSLKEGDKYTPGSLQFELSEPIKTIQEKIPGYPVVSFAYPFVDYNAHVIEETLKQYLAARAAGSEANAPNAIHWGTLNAYLLEFPEPRTLKSDFNKITKLEKYIQSTVIDEGNWGIYLAHDVLPLEEAIEAKDSWHPVSSESFESFAGWLKQKQDLKELWVAPMGSVTKYLKEKEMLTISEKEKSKNKILLLLNDQLSDEIYNQPISLEIAVPEDWKKVTIVQGKKKEQILVQDKKIRIQALPSKDVLEIIKIE